ncbi:hypothetical protein Bca101_089609 [Brassica carinata]
MTTMSDLPQDLTKEIFSRVPLTSLSAVRSTCKSWNSISKSQVLCESAARRKQFLGFMMKDFSVCSMKFDLQGIQNEADFVDPSIKQVSVLDQVEISQIFQCEGLLLCVTRDKSRLLMWNPYLGQTRCIQPRNTFLSGDQYALGYDKNRKHKILRILGDCKSGYMVLGEEQLAVLHYNWVMGQALEIWVTKKIDPGEVSWSKFLRFTSSCIGHIIPGSFFVDEEKKVVVVVDQDYNRRIVTGRNQSAHILGPDRYFKSVNIGETRYIGKRSKHGYMISELCRPRVCSSYVPSSVQLQTNQPVKSEESEN